MARRTQKASPRPVDPVNNAQDHTCLILALRGRSNRAIIKQTNLTPGQISYRLKKFEVSRMDFRNGEGQFAEAVDRATEGIAERALLKYLRAHVGKG